jgi:hypothetical protein
MRLRCCPAPHELVPLLFAGNVIFDKVKVPDFVEFQEDGICVSFISYGAAFQYRWDFGVKRNVPHRKCDAEFRVEKLENIEEIVPIG